MRAQATSSPCASLCHTLMMHTRACTACQVRGSGGPRDSAGPGLGNTLIRGRRPSRPVSHADGDDGEGERQAHRHRALQEAPGHGGPSRARTAGGAVRLPGHRPEYQEMTRSTSAAL